MGMHHDGVVTLYEFNRLLGILVEKIKADGFRPAVILALSSGGFPVATPLFKRLGLPRGTLLIGLPVYKDETGDYHLDESLVTLASSLAGIPVLVVDEASKRGELTRKVVRIVAERGGIAKSCVLIAWVGGRQPDFVAKTCHGEPPRFYWELLAE